MSGGTRTPILLAVLTMALLGFCTSAHADTRYATPGGLNTNDCTAPDMTHACDLQTAITSAGSGDEVIVGTGSYTLASSIASNLALSIHGDFAAPRPVIHETSGAAYLNVGGPLLAYLDLESDGGVALYGRSAVTERMRIVGAGLASIPVCQCYGTLIRDSVFVTTGTGTGPALGIVSNGGDATTTLRNLTAYSSSPNAPAIGLSQVHPTLGEVAYSGVNVVAARASGSPAVSADGHDTSMTFSHSNYPSGLGTNGATVGDAPLEGHQTDAPLFAGLDTLDFAEALGSPTIDAGLIDPANGPLDYAGNPRKLGSTTDIGAFETQGPAPQPAGEPPNTGEREKALKKCRKKKGRWKRRRVKHQKKKLRRCKRRARRLPI